MHSTDPTFPLYPVLAFIAFVVSFIPFPWHFRARNIGTCAYMLSTGLYSLVEFINSLIWADNTNNVAPFWCDISAQVIIGASIGITASTLAISRQLYNISKVQGVTKTPKEKRRDMIIDFALAFGLPILVMLLHFFVQPRRFDIFEQIGCQPATFNTLAAYLLYFMWPVLIGLGSLVWSVLTLRNFYLRRVEFAKASSNSAMTPGRYLRLMLLVFVDMFCNTPIGVFSIIVATREALLPFSTLSSTVDFSKVQFIPASEWKQNTLTNASVQINHWIPVFCSFVFFVFFGFAEEAKKNYRAFYLAIKKTLGFKDRSNASQAQRPKVRSKAFSMIASSARSPFSTTSSTIAPSVSDKYVPDDSYLSQTDTLDSPYSPYSCTSSTRPLMPGSGPSSRQASFVDVERRAGYFGAQIHGVGRPGSPLAEQKFEDIPLSWSPTKAAPPSYQGAHAV